MQAERSRSIPSIDHSTSIGAWIAGLTAVLALGTFIIAFLTPPLSGPYCLEGCYTYPYHDIASRYPRDYYWMFPAMIISLLTVMLTAAIHRQAIKEKRLFSSIGMLFMTMSSMLLIMDYFVQLAVIQPSLLRGEFDGISLLSQYNPHGIFIALEEIGFILSSLALVCIVPAIRNNGSGRAARWTFIIGFILVLIALIGYSVVFGLAREYRLEVALIPIVWFELIIGGSLLFFHFKKLRSDRSSNEVSIL